MALDGGFLHNLIKEINETAKECRVDKIHQPSRDEIVLQLRGYGFQKKLLISAKPTVARIGFITDAPENPKKPPMFSMLLRKYLGGAKLLEITQPDFERVAIFKFQSRNEMGDIIYPSIVVELIGANPNIIFIDTKGSIVDSVRRSDIEKGGRIIASGAKYTLPKGQKKLNPKSTFEELTAALTENPEKRLSDAILSSIDGISPLVAREVSFNCLGDIDKTAGDISTKQLKWLITKLQEFLSNGKPYLIKKPNGEEFEFSYMPIHQYGNDYKVTQVDSFSQLLEEFYGSRDRKQRIKSSSQDILKLLSNLSNRIGRKITARKGDLKKCEQKEKYRIYGELLKANLYRIEKGSESVKVVNYYSDNAEEIEIPLNPTISPADNASKYFKEYKKYCVAERTLVELLADAERELYYIDSVFESLSRAEYLNDIEAVRQELILSGYIRARGEKLKSQVSEPARYKTSDGFRVLAGKNNLQNDRLTTKIADKQDLWFHTKNIHGSHIILKLEGKEPTETAILEAAMIAAYNSKAQNSSGVAVDYTRVKNVKKPSGAKPGMVIYTTNNTVYVTPKESEIKNLKD